MKLEPIDIIIPTMDNFDQLTACLQSIYMTSPSHPFRIIVVNNGKIPIEKYLNKHLLNIVTVLTPNENLGWIGGLRLGLKHSTSPYVLFANDDIYIPRSSHRFLMEMVRGMDIIKNVGAVGPTSNVVMGNQNIFTPMTCKSYLVKYLIGFCMLVRRSALDEIGGVRDMDFGGDDIDLSIRFRKAGYKLVVLREVFVYHHGFQTGERVHGKPTDHNGWNSREMIENVQTELIQKNGFIPWWDTIIKGEDTNSDLRWEGPGDTEGEIIRQHVNGGRVVELGCGGRKTVPNAIGLDVVKGGDNIPFIDMTSVADIVADITEPLPLEDDYADCVIARHVLEHCLDTVAVLKHWDKILKTGGKMIIACPDERILNGIPLNPEHLHGFTPDSLESLTDLIGYKTLEKYSANNGISFINVMEKVERREN